MNNLKEILELHKKWLAGEKGGEGANLSDANLSGAIGNKKQIKSMQVDTYPIVYTHDRLQIGCENHDINGWKTFSDEKIKEMDDGALEWWAKWKDIIFKIIEMYPDEYNMENGNE